MSPTLRVGILVVAWTALAGILIAAGTLVVHSSGVTAFDHRVTSSVAARRTPALNVTMEGVTWIGSWVALVVTAILVMLLTVRGRLTWLAFVLGVAAWAGEAGAVALAKHVVHRERPPMDIWLQKAHGWSWPSGHAATAALVFAVLALLATQALSVRMVQLACWVMAITVVLAVGFSRIELGVHWTTDVVASFAFVSIWLVIVVLLFAPELSEAGRELR